MSIDIAEIEHHQACDEAYEDYQIAVQDYQTIPNDDRLRAALKKHQEWQALFLAPRARRVI